MLGYFFSRRRRLKEHMGDQGRKGRDEMGVKYSTDQRRMHGGGLEQKRRGQKEKSKVKDCFLHPGLHFHRFRRGKEKTEIEARRGPGVG